MMNDMVEDLRDVTNYEKNKMINLGEDLKNHYSTRRSLW